MATTCPAWTLAAEPPASSAKRPCVPGSSKGLMAADPSADDANGPLDGAARPAPMPIVSTDLHLEPSLPATRARPALLWRVRAALPSGHTLPERELARRHRGLLGLLWLQAVAVVVFALVEGYSLGHGLLEGGAVVGSLAALAT